MTLLNNSLPRVPEGSDVLVFNDHTGLPLCETWRRRDPEGHVRKLQKSEGAGIPRGRCWHSEREGELAPLPLQASVLSAPTAFQFYAGDSGVFSRRK